MICYEANSNDKTYLFGIHTAPLVLATFLEFLDYKFFQKNFKIKENISQANKTGSKNTANSLSGFLRVKTRITVGKIMTP